MWRPRLPDRSHGTIQYINLKTATDLPDISTMAPCLVVVSIEDSVTAARQKEISEWLVEMGCRYVLSCGQGCESWAETVRKANLDRKPGEDISPRDFVMITTHPNESLRQVFWYAKHHAVHPEVPFRTMIVLHLAERERAAQYQGIFHKT